MMTKLGFVLVASAVVAGCAGSPPPPAAGAGEDSPPAGENAGGSLSAAQCEAQGGTVVGDIGDGAIHKPGYVCPQTGKPPIGSISAEPGGPIAIEGSVCCGK